jgi:hypothetical protein
MADLTGKSIDTGAVHAGERAAGGGFTPVATPIQPSVGFLYENVQ